MPLAISYPQSNKQNQDSNGGDNLWRKEGSERGSPGCCTQLLQGGTRQPVEKVNPDHQLAGEHTQLPETGCLIFGWLNWREL